MDGIDMLQRLQLPCCKWVLQELNPGAVGAAESAARIPGVGG